MQTTYPLANDLTTFLIATGLSDSSGSGFTQIGLQAKLAAAIAEWERRTGFVPFLADYAVTDGTTAPVVSTRYFDPPGPIAGSGRSGGARGGRVLDLDGGLLSIASLNVGVVPDGMGNYAQGAGSPLTANVHYFPRPRNAAAQGQAWTEIEFLAPQRGQPQSIAVSGVWGRCLTLPGDVYEAILQGAAALCVPELALAISGGMVERKVGDSTKRFAISGVDGPLAQQETLWTNTFDSTARRYKRILV